MPRSMVTYLLSRIPGYPEREFCCVLEYLDKSSRYLLNCKKKGHFFEGGGGDLGRSPLSLTTKFFCAIICFL